MKNLFAYDFTNRTIVATKATLKKASNPTTDEYKVLIKMIEGQPTFRVVEKTIKNSGNKKTYKGLTLKMMMDYTQSAVATEQIRRFRICPLEVFVQKCEFFSAERYNGGIVLCFHLRHFYLCVFVDAKAVVEINGEVVAGICLPENEIKHLQKTFGVLIGISLLAVESNEVVVDF